MNRLVIIGNGFDLAHGLPTGYCDFINHYWRNVVKIGYDFLISNYTEYEDNLIKTNVNLSAFDYNGRRVLIEEYKNISSYADFKEFTSKYDCDEKTKQKVNFKNSLFGKINELHSAQNWVDIENEYYSQLKALAKSNSKIKVKKLNEEFEDLKKLLEEYLAEQVEGYFELLKKEKDENDWTKFYHILKPISIFNNERNIKLEFNHKEDKDTIDLFFKSQKIHQTHKSKSFLLNFNYTSTVDKYMASFKEGEIEAEQNQIHGRINKEENKINFGFGDEMDDDYKIIENFNDNEYLRNFKSFQYLQNSNYSNLLSFIDSEKFQVLIMGHSCGLSDRTLLNTIFEHNNCRSIKVFYHQWKDKETDETKDNYTEIIQNISRHFNKKKLMREKIVNKTLCQPLPQIQLPKKE
jgi:Bacteriophage abortive infection AbiH